MSKHVPTALGGQSPEEAARVAKDAASAALENLKTQIKQETEQEFIDLIHELSATDRSKVPQIYENPQHRNVIELRSPTLPLYARLSSEEQQWRNPDSDHYMAEWLRGHFDGDHARMMLAQEKLSGMFRANIVEGTEGTSGAFSGGTGGALIPRPMEALVMIARDRVAKARRFFTIYQMTAQQHNIPTAASMTAFMVAENTSSTQGEPLFGAVSLVAKVACVKAVASKEMLRDSAYNLVTIFATRGGGALGVLEDNQVFQSPEGANDIKKLGGSTYNELTSNNFAYQDALAMYFNVPQQYRDNAIWLASPDVLRKLSNVRDGTLGRPLYIGLTDEPGPITDDPSAVGYIFRKKVYEVPFTAGDLWFGDPTAQYAFGDRQGIEVDVSEHTLFTNRQVMWLLTERIAGNNVDSSASQYCTGLTGTFTNS